MNLTDKIFEKLKNNKLVAIVLVTAAILLGAINFFERALTFYGKHIASELQLVSMSLSVDSANIFTDYEGPSCRRDQPTIRTFQPKDEHLPSGRLDLAFTFTNMGKTPVAFKAAILDVEFIERMAGGGPGVVNPNYTYVLEIDFDTGVQRFPLTPVYNIPSLDTGAFVLALTPSSSGIGRCWISRIVFDTTAGLVTSKRFQMILSRD